MYYIGIDLGGTNIKGALVSETGEIAREVSRPTRVGLGAEAVCDGIAAVITELSSGVDRTSLGGVGLGCPGTVDDETGRVLYANNLGWKNFDLRAAVKSRTDFDLRIGNDANVAALAEALVGCAKGAQSAVITSSEKNPEEQETIQALEDAGVKDILLTRGGEITLQSDGRKLDFTQK